MKSAFDMNRFAVENGYSVVTWGMPTGFASIEAKLEEGEEVVFACVASKLSDKKGRVVFNGNFALAITIGRMMISGRISDRQTVRSFPIWDCERISLKRSGILGRIELVIEFKLESVRIAGTNEFVKHLKDGVEEAIQKLT